MASQQTTRVSISATPQTSTVSTSTSSGSGQALAKKVAASKNRGNRTNQTYSSSDKQASADAKNNAARRSTENTEAVNTVAQQTTPTTEQTLANDPNIVASSRNKDQYISASGERVTPIASYEAPYTPVNQYENTGIITASKSAPTQRRYSLSSAERNRIQADKEANERSRTIRQGTVQPASGSTFVSKVKGQAQLFARGFTNAAGFRADTVEDDVLYKQRPGSGTFGGSTTYELGQYAGAIAKPFSYVGGIKVIKAIPAPFRSGIANSVLGGGIVSGGTYGYSKARNEFGSDRYGGLTQDQIYEVGRESGGNVFQQVFPVFQSQKSFSSRAEKVLLDKGYAKNEREAVQLAGYVAERYKGSITKPLSPTSVDTFGAVAYNRVTEAGGRLSFTNVFSKLQKNGVSLTQKTQTFGKTLSPQAKLFNLGAGVIGVQGSVEGTSEYLNYKTFRGERPTASGLAYSSVGGAFVAGTIGGGIIAAPYIKSPTIRRAVNFADFTVNVLDPAEKPGDLVQDAVEASALRKGKVVFSAQTTKVGKDIFPEVVGRYGAKTSFSANAPSFGDGYSFTPSSSSRSSSRTSSSGRSRSSSPSRESFSFSPAQNNNPVNTISPLTASITTKNPLTTTSNSNSITNNNLVPTSARTTLPVPVTAKLPASIKNPVSVKIPVTIKNTVPVKVGVKVKVPTGLGLPFVPPGGGLGNWGRGGRGSKQKFKYTPSLVGIETRRLVKGVGKATGNSGLEVRGITKRQLAFINGNGKRFVRF